MSYFEKRLKEIRSDLDCVQSADDTRRIRKDRKSRLKDINSVFVVYHCYLDDELVYIGSGKIGREEHCNSGCSHVYELNKAHFEGRNISTKIHKRFNNKKDSVDCEKEQIRTLSPRLNVVFVEEHILSPVNQMHEYSRKKSEWLKYIDSVKIPRKEKVKVLKFFNNLVDNFTIPMLESGKILRKQLSGKNGEPPICGWTGLRDISGMKKVKFLDNFLDLWFTPDLKYVKFVKEIPEIKETHENKSN